MQNKKSSQRGVASLVVAKFIETTTGSLLKRVHFTPEKTSRLGDLGGGGGAGKAIALIGKSTSRRSKKKDRDLVAARFWGV